jgi:hypothetical protein
MSISPILTTILLLPLHLLTLFSLFSLISPLITHFYIHTNIPNRLLLLRLQKHADAYKPHIYTPLNLLLHPDSESGITKQDLAATQAMTSARRIALFGPLACIPAMLAMPIMLYLGITHLESNPSWTMIGLFTTIAIFIMLMITCSTASTVHRYFSLVETEQPLLFDETIKPASHECLQSHGMKKAYLTILFAFCRVNCQNMGLERAAGCQSRHGGGVVVEEIMYGLEDR